MLERVALNQTRFNLPGVAADPRGVLLGRQAALRFASLDRLIGFLRIFTEDAALDDLLPSLEIWQVRAPLGGGDLVLRFAAQGSHQVDRAARIARLLGGEAYTGGGRHFVRYRDERSPLGYDVDQVWSGEADLVLYHPDFVQPYARARILEPAQLVLRLSPQRVAGADEEDRERLLLRLERGLGRRTLLYLWRNRVRAELALTGPPAPLHPSAGVDPGADRAAGAMLARVAGLPLRLFRLLRSVPGIELLRPVTDQAAVEVGYRHPLDLRACASLFGEERLHLFLGRRDVVEVVEGPPSFVSAGQLTDLRFDLGRDRRAPVGPTVAPAPFEVTLRLAPARGASRPRRVTAALVPWAQAGWLKRLVYALPPVVLEGYRVALVDPAIVLVAPGGISDVPLGEPMAELAPGLYAPVGHELLPRVAPELLAERLGASAARPVFFPRGGAAPFALEEGALTPLGRRAVAHLEVERAAPRPGGAPEPGPPRLLNLPLGNLVLWGFEGPPRR